MKNFITSALLLLALLLPATAAAHDIEVDSIFYDIDGDEATVTYDGSSGGFYPSTYSGDITIPEEVTHEGVTYRVTAIGDNAFARCTELTGIIIPGSVTAIGDRAFYGCKGLTDVTIPNSVDWIGSRAFAFCTRLSSVTLPNSLFEISNGMFSSCQSLTSVTIPGSVIAINDNAFTSCSSLESVDIPNSVSSIGKSAFSNCTSLKSVTIPSSVSILNERVFGWCHSLTNVTIPKHVTTIAYRAFYDCHKLTSVVIPASVRTIGTEVFAYCYNLESLTVEQGNPKYDSRENCNAIIETASNTLITGCQATVIPSSVTAIGDNAFRGCFELRSVEIPEPVATIGKEAFTGCISLKEMTIPGTVSAIGYQAFSYCSSLTNIYCYITDPSTVTLGEEIFYIENPEWDYSTRKLYVPKGSGSAYMRDKNWYPYFGRILEMQPAPVLTGDVNLDGAVDIADINAVVDIILGVNASTAAADVNSDSEVSIADINAIIDIILSNQEHQEHEWVDLGLPSGTLWATCNVGASSPEQYGGYFAWGETEPKEAFTWENYKWYDSSNESLTKYCTDSEDGTVDGKTILDPQDDAAYVNWGTEWRMPTQEQIEELRRYCISTRTEVNGVKGRLITGRNGNTIFLPGTGDWYNPERPGNYSGDYWSCTGKNRYAEGLWTDSGVNSWGFFSGFRYNGHTIRPVRNHSADFYIVEKSLDLGVVPVGAPHTVKLTIVNNTKYQMTFTATADEPFMLQQDENSVPSMEFVIPGGSSLPVNVIFNGSDHGPFDGNVTIAADGDQSVVPVHVLAYSPVNTEVEYVDLGLPSGTLWASCNVGASSPEQYGDYFAWGETEPKEVYSWETYKWCNGTEKSLTKYCTNSDYGTKDNKSELDLEDDAAFVNMGPSWRMPSNEQLEELHYDCRWKWTTLNGEEGGLVIGPNGNTIFMPCPGTRCDSSLNDAGWEGLYWSREITHFDHPGGAYCTDFSTVVGSARFLGYSVRAVRQSTDDAFVEQERLDLDGVLVGETSTGELTLVNNTTEAITMTATADAPFTLKQEGDSTTSMAVTVPGKSFARVTVMFTASTPGQHDGNVTIQHPALDGGQRVIPVHGRAISDDLMNKEYIDLGLPSGTLWATRDVGADSPEQFGDKFTWGSTTPLNSSSMSINKSSDDSDDGMTTRNMDSRRSSFWDGIPQPGNELSPGSDAAYVNWGSEWRTPSIQQIVELLESCTYSRARINDVIGRLVTGPNGNSIFIPTDAEYWSRTRVKDSTSVFGMSMESSDLSWAISWGPGGWDKRVRPVRVSQQ
ncbi:MAG: leucine-rich repeat protein [Muribaculaceae bacterium]|nr:leucine-rich repeat protein [Muribaculaceae bacterium]